MYMTYVWYANVCITFLSTSEISLQSNVEIKSFKRSYFPFEGSFSRAICAESLGAIFSSERCGRATNVLGL